MLETSAIDVANEAYVSSVSAISTSTHAGEVADSVETRAAVAIVEAKTAVAAVAEARAARDIVRAAPNPDDIFLESDFPPFGMEGVLEGCHDNSASLGYLLGESEKACETMTKFEERFEAFQEIIYKDCEWVSRGRYFKMENMTRARCYELNCLS
ncbi:hypothetical protein GGI19_006922 [Coemansia pectinata]|uniref:Uncharacterized protein n=1 Tax=Coemansia pectinata TaxID=1052879 RepID=A0A9W8L737_9FUNG|nr:hypothetical protein GGI19_006922 [Coemansia pectinata]